MTRAGKMSVNAHQPILSYIKKFEVFLKYESIKPLYSDPNAPNGNQTSKMIFICKFSERSICFSARILQLLLMNHAHTIPIHTHAVYTQCSIQVGYLHKHNQFMSLSEPLGNCWGKHLMCKHILDPRLHNLSLSH